MTAPRLEVRSLSKTFAGITVLKDAYLEVRPGEVHALIGQNGSGKSTLIKLVSGVYRADSGGEVLVDGKRIGTPVDPGRLHEEGLAFVHQDLGLIHDLSVRENVRVGRHSTMPYTGWINRRKDAAAVRETLELLHLSHISPQTKVGALRPSERVGVAVARALQERHPGSGVVVFDESSRAIPYEALDDFYDMIRLLTSQGTAVIIVSHNLKEVLQIADRVTALRNGRVVEMGVSTSGLDEAALTRMVLGRDGELDDFVESMPSELRERGLELKEVAGGAIRGVSAAVRRGEVVGFTGTVDSGLSSLAPLLAGAITGSGTVAVGYRELSLERASVKKALRAGVAYIPQDRHGQGLATALTVEENVTLPHLHSRGKPWWTGLGWQKVETESVLKTFEVTPANRHAPVATFSGGNQQKVLMGKWLLGAPTALVLDDPTQAVDVGARAAVLRATRQAAVDGAAVVLCSSEVDDLAAVCDRVLVLEQGSVVRELTRPFTADDVFSAIFHDPEGSDR
ncbi:sugar ABC transporter ATP-binding protein [Georgenia yuyongxinii]|uniref:Sugar ABC transporter ATP-binding protein n=1 Tax=Georgenia yuyongxinii TaxID=2589797 RepID=A0A552WWC3_9MICO|nr:sugar ABC transporter ATP-binding protein [Georgenia yuyongxinii]TRW47025.1 sugar ABC transporter ATP-binding protein [Georgenia yuyongxinii]